MTLGDRTWTRAVSMGLILLLISYATAFQITLVMNLRTQSLAAVNIPAPKIAAVALIQRSVGSRPGPWGVTGTLAVMGSALAVWLLTVPRRQRGGDDALLSLRGMTRWVCILTTGGALGFMLTCHNLSTWSGIALAPFLAVMLLLCELPSNTLLYLHLRRLAQELGERGIAPLLKLCAMAVPLATLGASSLLVFSTEEELSTLGMIYIVFGATVTAVGLMATGLVLRLTATATARAFAEFGTPGRRAVVQVLAFLRQSVHAMKQDPARWSAAAGIAAWIILQPWLLHESLMAGPRTQFGGDMPYVNLVGPKVSFIPALFPDSASADGINYRLYGYYTTRNGFFLVFAEVLAIWLITYRPTVDPRRWLRGSVRWGSTCTAGIVVGWVHHMGTFRATELIVTTVVIGELVTTVLLYLYLASLARRIRDGCAAAFLRLAVGAGILIALPYLYVVLSWFPRWPHEMKAVWVTAAAIMAASVGFCMIALSELARLILHMVWPVSLRSGRLSSPAPTLASSAA